MAQVTVDLRAQNRQLNVALARTRRDFERLRREVGNNRREAERLGRVSQTVGNQLRAIGPTLSLAGFAAGINAATRYAEQVELIGLSSGLTADEIQRLSVVAARADLDLNSIDNVTQRIVASTGEARRGVTEYAEAFRRLGIDATASISEIIADLTSLNNLTPETVADIRRIGGRDATRLARAAISGGNVDIAPVSAETISALTTLRAAISDTSTSLGRLATETLAGFTGGLTAAAEAIEALSEAARGQEGSFGVELPEAEATLREWSATVDRWITANEDIPQFIRDALLTTIPVPMMADQQLRDIIRSLRGLQLAPPAFVAPSAAATAVVPLPPPDPANLRLNFQRQAYQDFQRELEASAEALMRTTMESERFRTVFLPNLIADLNERIEAERLAHNENVLRNHALLTEAGVIRDLNFAIEQTRRARESEIASIESLGRSIGSAIGNARDLETALQQIFGAVLGHTLESLFTGGLTGGGLNVEPVLPPLLGPRGALGELGRTTENLPVTSPISRSPGPATTIQQTVNIRVSGSDAAAVRRGIRQALPAIGQAAKTAVAADISRPSALRSRFRNQ